MPGDKPGKAAQQLSEAQIRELVAWADATPGGADGKALHDKLQSMGVDVCLSAAYTFKRKRITPALEQISAARAIAADISEGIAGGDDLAQGTNLLIQRMVLDRVLMMQRNGMDISDPEIRKEMRELFTVAAEGMSARTQGRVADARIDKLKLETEKLNAQVSQLRSDIEARNAAVDNLTRNDGKGMSIEARNAIRRELGLSPIEPEAVPA